MVHHAWDGGAGDERPVGKKEGGEVVETLLCLDMFVLGEGIFYLAG